MAFGSFTCDSATGITWRPCLRNRSPAPGATQIESIEMRDLPIASVTHHRRGEQRGWLSHCEAWKKTIQPHQEAGRAEHSPHALGFHQRARQKIIAAWLPDLAVGVVAKPGFRLRRQCFSQRGVARDLGILECESNRERAVEVRADAGRVGGLWQKRQKTRAERVG